MRLYSRPELGDLKLEDRENGIQISQRKKSYIARKWRLTDQVVGIVDAAINAGLTCLWQEGHPGGETSHHISFSFSHSKASWIFVLGGEARPPEVRSITVSKKLVSLLRASGIHHFWESAGGKNFTIMPHDLQAFLDFMAKSPLADGRKLPPFALGQQVSKVHGFMTERQIEDKIFERLILREGEPKTVTHRQFGFASSRFVGGRDIPDLIFQMSDVAIIVEIKRYRGIEQELYQIARYLENENIKTAFHNLKCHGVIVADSFSQLVIDQVIASGNMSLYAFTDSTVFPLNHVAGEDMPIPTKPPGYNGIMPPGDS